MLGHGSKHCKTGSFVEVCNIILLPFQSRVQVKRLKRARALHETFLHRLTMGRSFTLSGMREELPCTWFLKKCSNYCFAPCAAPEKMKTCQWFHSPLARFAKCTRNVITQLKVIYISSVSPSWEWNNFVRYKSVLHNVASMYRDLHCIIDYLRKFEILIIVSVRKRTGHDSSLPIAH